MVAETDPRESEQSPQPPPEGDEPIAMVPEPVLEPEAGDPGPLGTDVVAKGGRRDGTEFRIRDSEPGDPGLIGTEPVTEGERRSEDAE